MRPGHRVDQGAELDESLAHGTNPLASQALTVQAEALIRPGKRIELARALELVIRQVMTGGPSPAPGPVILRREPIARNTRGLLILVDRLRDNRLHCLTGLAMADRLISFGDSPLYLGLDPRQLGYRIEETMAALDPDWDGQPADLTARGPGL